MTPIKITTTETPGVYTLIATAPNGCTISESVTVTGNADLPNIQINDAGNLDCDQTDIILVGSSSIPDPIFEWITSDTTIVNDSLLVSTADTILLSVINAVNGCSSDTTIIILEDDEMPFR